MYRRAFGPKTVLGLSDDDWRVGAEPHHLRNQSGEAFGVARDPSAIMLLHHCGIGMAQLSSNPFDGHVTRQRLAGKCMTALVRPSVPDAYLFQVIGKPPTNT